MHTPSSSRARTVFRSLLVIGAAAALALAGCSSDTEDSAPSTSAATATIMIEGHAYQTPATVPAGAEIAIQNHDSAEHSVTSDEAGVFTIDIEEHETATLTAPSTPGTYNFHCKYHPDMHGTLNVV